MKKDKHKWIKYIKQLFIRFKDDNISALSAQLTFFILMSLFPFLLFFLTVLSFTIISTTEFIQNTERFLPKDVYMLISNLVKEMHNSISPGLLSFGALVTIWGASRGIGAISYGLNKAYDKEENRPFWKLTVITVVFTIAIAVMILVTLLFLIFGEFLLDKIFGVFCNEQGLIELWGVLRYIVPIVIIFFVLSLLYTIVPNCHLKFKEVLPGSIFSTIGWVIASTAFSFYVNNFSSYTRIYGSIGGIIILLIWLYISSITILLGAEINATSSYYRLNLKIDKYENLNLKIPFLNRIKEKKK